MQIESIEIQNYRLFRDAKLTDLQGMAVVVGANGSGKSTRSEVFSLPKYSLAQLPDPNCRNRQDCAVSRQPKQEN